MIKTKLATTIFAIFLMLSSIDFSNASPNHGVGEYENGYSNQQTDIRPTETSRSKGTIVHSGRPSVCPSRLWCGCWLSVEYFGKSVRELWLAKNWLKFPRTTPSVGSVAVMGRRGGGHVGIVQSFDDNGNPVIKSGNHNGVVATSTYPKNRIIAYVSPR